MGPRLRFAVLGAGNGGTALAGHLGLLGHPVRLYNRTREALLPVSAAGGVRLAGALTGFGPLELCTDKLADAVQDADVILVATPATAHRELAGQLAPLVGPKTLVVLLPGRTGGALEFARALSEHGGACQVGEAQSFPYACRRLPGGQAYIYQVKRWVPFAAFPATANRPALAILRSVFPQFVGVPDVWHTSLENIGAVFHPAPLILNAGKVESGIDFDYYHEGMTPSVAAVMEGVDAERLAVARALGVRVLSAREWLRRAYGASGATLYQAIQNNPAYRGIRAPRTLQHRYISEDVPTGLVPLASLGRQLDVPTPQIDSLIELANRIHGVDYRATGRSVARLGLLGLDAGSMVTLARTGRLPAPAASGWVGSDGAGLDAMLEERPAL